MLAGKHPAERSCQLAANTRREFLGQALRHLDIVGAPVMSRCCAIGRTLVFPRPGVSGSDGRA